MQIDITGKLFSIFFTICFFILFIIFLSNYVQNKKGTFFDHTENILLLLQKPTFKKVAFESKGETECRRVMEKLFQKPFPRIRPKFLTSPKTNKRLELDCYNEDLKLAVEYNGQQHYYYNPYFHKSFQDFLDIKERDLFKKKMCKQSGIKLIVVPFSVQNSEIESFILNKLRFA